jgi:GT2 family glycosyltransferase
MLIFIFDTSNEHTVDTVLARLRNQIYDNWSALLLFDTVSQSHFLRVARSAAQRDKRISVDVKRNIPLATIVPENASIIFASGDVLLREHAVYMFVVAASGREECVVYSDEGGLDENGDPVDPLFKPDYSPELFKGGNYIGPCFLVRCSTASAEVLWSHVVENGIAQLGRVIVNVEQPNKFIHVPTILFDTLSPRRCDCVQPPVLPDLGNQVPSVSIIVPTRDQRHLLEECISSISDLTDYPRDKWEIIVVDNGSVEPDALQYMVTTESAGLMRRIRSSDTFNFARLNNIAAISAKNDILLFLNNDTVVIDKMWLRRLVSFAVQKDVGAVGAKLLYPDRHVQHGGVVLGIQGVAAHCHVGLPEREGGYANLNNLTREVSAVTGACLAIRREVFFQIGGFDPELAVAFNDTVLCLNCVRNGYRNIVLAEPLLIHHESKTRGYDDSPEKIALFRKEARIARHRNNSLFKDDPLYNPNLSLECTYELAFPPRRIKPWQVWFGRPRSLRILLLSATYERGHGVAVVVDLQSTFLAELGHEVFVGGPAGGQEMPYRGSTRVKLHDAKDAAIFAVEQDIDCIVVHTPPFFSIVRHLGLYPLTVFYDHGEPPPNMFPDARKRKTEQEEKRFCFALADQLIAISPVVRSEIDERHVAIIPNCNSHLSVWNDNYKARRRRFRSEMGWDKKVIVLNVCRFHKAERYYKGVNRYGDIFAKLRMTRPEIASRTTFVLCGKASEEDVEEVRPLGFEVFANVPDQQLAELYAAADIYMSFSRWEGYNLGVAQALAMGLPVIASDIPAHRDFPAFTSDDDEQILERVASLVEQGPEEALNDRKPVVADWATSLVALSKIIEKCYDFKYNFVSRHASHFG